jgi:transcriptional regulator with XRE-family HTH domain
MNPFSTRQPTLLTTATALGPVVRERRKSQSLRIDDAAGLLGVSVDLMSRLENGQGSVRLDKALAVLDGLGLTLMVLPKEHPWARELDSIRPTTPAIDTKA